MRGLKKKRKKTMVYNTHPPPKKKNTVLFHSNCCCSIAWKKTCCCSRSDILFLARTARAPLRRVTHAFIGETKQMHPRKAQVCTKTFINTVPGLRRSMCHPTFQCICFHFSIQACHRLWNLSVEPFNQSLNTESMAFLCGTLHSTLFQIQPFAQVSKLFGQHGC